jgi:hypothetical protein
LERPINQTGALRGFVRGIATVYGSSVRGPLLLLD